MTRYFPLILLFALFGCMLPACAQKAAPQQAKTKKVSQKAAAHPKPRTEAGPVLTFERTPCFGTCPGYLVQVYADGRVAYEGRRAVPIMGKQELRLPAATVADMLRQANEAHFDQFEDRYAGNTSDLPGIVVAIRQPSGKFKTVAVEEGAPDNVRALFNSLGTQFDQLAQVNGLEK